MPSNENEIALPGFEGLVLPDTDRAGSQDFTDAKKYTGLTIRRDYPQTFDSVVRALFYYKLPIRACADLFRMNSQCVGAIRDMVIAEAATDERAAFLINSRQKSQRDLVITRLVETIAEKLEDPETVKRMGIDELTLILNRLESAKPARNGTDEPSKSPKLRKGEVIDVDKFDVIMDGLNQEKKSAERSGAEAALEDNPGAGETHSGCSTANENTGYAHCN